MDLFCRGGEFASPSSEATTYTISSETTTITANYEIDTFTLTYNAGTNGFVNTGAGNVPQFQETINYMTDGSQVTAVPDTGYHFISWSDGDPGPPPVPDVIRQDVDVTGDLTATANFAINTYIVSFTAGANGSISGSTTQTVNYGADSQAITVTPDAGYTFYCTENHSKTTSTLTINNVTSAMNVIVHFLEITGDSDADGLPDGWEIDNFGNLSQNATGDNDNDELSNLIEYNNSYNPNDQNDPGLLINTITNPEDGGTL